MELYFFLYLMMDHLALEELNLPLKALCLPILLVFFLRVCYWHLIQVHLKLDFKEQLLVLEPLLLLMVMVKYPKLHYFIDAVANNQYLMDFYIMILFLTSTFQHTSMCLQYDQLNQIQDLYMQSSQFSITFHSKMNLSKPSLISKL